MLRIAVIGAGRTVQIGHAPALQALGEQYEVAAIADRDSAALEQLGILLKVPPAHRYTDYRELLLREAVDVVDITLPHAFHHEVAVQALQAGAHIITERPLSLSLRDAEELLRLAERRGRLATVLHFYLWYPPFREAVRLVRTGAIGEPFLVRCEGVTGGFGLGTAAYHPEWHGNPEIAGGGVWIDSGYHGVYLCAALAGSPVVSVAASMATYASDAPVEDTAAVLLTHESGATSSIQVAWSVPAGGTRVFEIYGSEGAIVLDHEGYPLGVFSNATRAWSHPEITYHRAGSFVDLFSAIAECLQYGAPPPVSHRDALQTLDTVLAAYRANEQGTVESVGGLWGV